MRGATLILAGALLACGSPQAPAKIERAAPSASTLANPCAAADAFAARFDALVAEGRIERASRAMRASIDACPNEARKQMLDAIIAELSNARTLDGRAIARQALETMKRGDEAGARRLLDHAAVALTSETGEPPHLIHWAENVQVGPARYSADAHTLAVAYDDHIAIFDGTTFEPRLLLHSKDHVTDLRVSPHGSVVMGAERWWDLATAKTLEHPPPGAEDFAFAPDESRVAGLTTGTEDAPPTIVVSDLRTGAIARRITLAKGSSTWAVALGEASVFVIDSTETVRNGGRDTSSNTMVVARTFDVATGAQTQHAIGTFACHTIVPQTRPGGRGGVARPDNCESIESVSISPDGVIAAVLMRHTTPSATSMALRVVRFSNGTTLATYTRPFTSATTDLVVASTAPDEHTIAWAEYDGAPQSITRYRLDAHGTKLVSECAAPSGGEHIFSPDASRFTDGVGPHARVYDAATCALLSTLPAWEPINFTSDAVAARDRALAFGIASAPDGSLTTTLTESGRTLITRERNDISIRAIPSRALIATLDFAAHTDAAIATSPSGYYEDFGAATSSVLRCVAGAYVLPIEVCSERWLERGLLKRALSGESIESPVD